MSDEDNVLDVHMEILREIRRELREFRAEAATKAELRSGLADVTGRIDRVEDETIRGFEGVRREFDRVHTRIDGTNARIDHLIETISPG